MEHYAGVGSRQTPPDILDLMTDTAQYLRASGWHLRSGGAVGADTAFQSGAGTDCTVYRPRRDLPGWAFETVTRFHPAPDRLSPYATQLHARNALIMLGDDGESPVKFVVCWTPDGRITGGTGQALRIADHYGIPVRNLGSPAVLARVREVVIP